jgi:hypothetical protein
MILTSKGPKLHNLPIIYKLNLAQISTAKKIKKNSYFA